jgi:hypothetical protein
MCNKKAPLVAEPPQRPIPLELSRDRRESGGAHTVSNACVAAFVPVPAATASKSKTASTEPARISISMRGFYLLQRRRQRR